jgi:hypothetical protein
MLRKIISNSQNVFISSRQILDSALIDGECLDSRIRLEELVVLCKLDLKEYDHVSWKSLLYLLKRCGFGEKWIVLLRCSFPFLLMVHCPEFLPTLTD